MYTHTLSLIFPNMAVGERKEKVEERGDGKGGEAGQTERVGRGGSPRYTFLQKNPMLAEDT